MEYSSFLDEPSWSFQNLIDSSFDQSEFIHMDVTPIDSSDLSSLFINSPNEFSTEVDSYPFAHLFNTDDLIQVTSQVEEVSMDLGGFETDLMVEGFFGNSLEGSEGSFPSQQASSHHFSTQGNDVWSPNSVVTSEESLMDSTSIQSPLTLPREEEGIENELSIRHLFQAYAEAMEYGQKELEEVILRCISEKVSPIGESFERLAFNLSQEVADEHQQGGDYLKQESLKNFEAAFKVFIQNFPYARFAHYVANSAILEAIPVEAETVHIVDFDMGEGIQLSQIIEALAQRFKTLKVTAIKWEEEEGDCAPPHWRFEETKKQLQKHARSFGLNLKMEEVAMENLVTEMKKAKKRGGAKEFLAFNCMVSLSHMRRRRSRTHVMEYLRLAKELLANSGNFRTSKNGIITFGDGDASEKLGNHSSFSSFFNENLVHYQALLESMESNFPSHLAEARMVMECIFVAPFVSSHAWLQKWTEVKDCNVQPWFGLDGRRLSNENLMEAKEIVGDEGSYGIRIQGQNRNEMVLEYRGTPLIRVSTWESQS
ncbi:protein NODULATION SIGNALING PATHWAY 2-like [Argentina anserina]|uniref:protein NODULATION SIGNALING PATHWAY 2-like n=1 Tax=Argentina anserina TaxID=57926 RepID=UPI0021767E88|nr:protein NODULATION SIGNALING PATHWAY 2-like [Potentilla anserina]